MNNKKSKINSILITILMVIILIVVVKDDYKQILQILTKMNLIFILLAILSYSMYVILYGYLGYITINQKDKVSLLTSIKLYLIR